MKVTATAYLGSSSLMSPEELHNATPEELVKHLTFRDESAFWVEIGYTKVGTAKIEIQLVPQSDMIVNKIESLRAQMQEVKAESQKKIQDIAVQIQNLLAIEGIK
jgi:hypothetical protein